MSDRDVINTAIAESGAHPDGLAATLYTIFNRSLRDKQTPTQVVQAKHQYEGYSAPGPASVKAQNDPKVRALAEKVWQQVQARSIPDPTNGGFDFRAERLAHQLTAPHGTVTIAGNTYAKGNSAPQTATAAIDAAVAPNPQQRPSALAYAQPPASVRAISVQPNGQAASLLDALTAKYGSATPTAPGASGQSVTGMQLPDAMPRPRVASLSTPPIPQGLVSHPVQTLRIDPMTNEVMQPNAAPSLQDAVNAKASRIASGQEAFTQRIAANVPPPIPAPTGGAFTGGWGSTAPIINPSIRSVPPKTDFQLLTPPNEAAFLDPNKWAAQHNQVQTAFANVAPVPHPYPVAAPSIPGRPNAAQVAAINAISTVPLTHTAVASQDRLPPLPPTAYAPVAPKAPALNAITDLMKPTGPAFNAQTWGNAGLARLPTVPVPTVPALAYVGKQPLTKFLPANQRQNDTLTTAGNVAGNLLSATPAGHVWSLLTGAPNTGGGILNGLFGYGGLFGGSNTPAPSFAPPQAAAPVNDARYQQAQSDLRNSGMIDSFGMLTGSGGHSDAAH